MQLKQRQKIISTVTLLAFLSFFLPTYFIHACVLGWDPIGTCILEGAFSFASMIFGLIGNLTAIVAKGLNYAIFVRPGGNILIVDTTWKILRDFSNMIFIVLLIYMAFATIFDQGKYRFESMIVRFLIVAVLINFSLVIGNFIIDFCQVLTNIFLGSIGNLGDRLGTFMNPVVLFPDITKIATADATTGGLISIVFAIILSLIFLFSILVALVFAIVRTPIIWALLIVSPLAWMSYILPSSGGWWKKWWNQFFGWNLFLPVYLFFIYLGLIFLSKRDEIMGAVIQANKTAGATNPTDVPLLAGLTNSLSFNHLFFYLFTAFVMVGGTWAAKETTSLMGTGFDKGLGWSKGFVKRLPIFGKGRSLDSYEYASKQKFGQFQKEGFQNQYLNKIYGGQAGVDRARASASGQWPFRNQKQFAENAKTAYTKAENDYSTGKMDIEQLRQKARNNSASNAEGYAYRKLLVEKGGMDGDMYKQTLLQLKGSPYAVNDFVKAAKEKKFAGIRNLKDVALDDSLNDSSFVASRREMLQYIASDAKMAGGMKEDDTSKAIRVLGGKDSPESKKFLDDLTKVRPDLVFKFKQDPTRGVIVDLYEKDKDGNPKVTTEDEYWTKAVRTEAKNLIDMPKDVWNNLKFQNALQLRFNELKANKQRRNLKDNLEKLLVEKGESRTGQLDDKNRADKLDILDKITPSIVGEPDDNEGEGQNQNTEPTTPAPDEGEKTTETGGGTAKTVSYLKTMGINRSNVIDLRTADLKNKTGDE